MSKKEGAAGISGNSHHLISGAREVLRILQRIPGVLKVNTGGGSEQKTSTIRRVKIRWDRRRTRILVKICNNSGFQDFSVFLKDLRHGGKVARDIAIELATRLDYQPQNLIPGPKGATRVETVKEERQDVITIQTADEEQQEQFVVDEPQQPIDEIEETEEDATEELSWNQKKDGIVEILFDQACAQGQIEKDSNGNPVLRNFSVWKFLAEQGYRSKRLLTKAMDELRREGRLVNIGPVGTRGVWVIGINKSVSVMEINAGKKKKPAVRRAPEEAYRIMLGIALTQNGTTQTEKGLEFQVPFVKTLKELGWTTAQAAKASAVLQAQGLMTHPSPAAKNWYIVVPDNKIVVEEEKGEEMEEKATRVTQEELAAFAGFNDNVFDPKQFFEMDREAIKRMVRNFVLGTRVDDTVRERYEQVKAVTEFLNLTVDGLQMPVEMLTGTEEDGVRALIVYYQSVAKKAEEQ